MMNFWCALKCFWIWIINQKCLLHIIPQRDFKQVIYIVHCVRKIQIEIPSHIMMSIYIRCILSNLRKKYNYDFSSDFSLWWSDRIIDFFFDFDHLLKIETLEMSLLIKTCYWIVYSVSAIILKRKGFLLLDFWRYIWNENYNKIVRFESTYNNNIQRKQFNSKIL